METGLKKVTSATVVDGQIVFKSGLFSWRVAPPEIAKIRMEKVFSLYDEIGLTVEENHRFFMTDATPGFNDIKELMDFDHLFGENWFQRTEAGEHLLWSRS